ncbi:ribonucleotide reductase subunit alpha [uncultured Neptuniibacter sp.]|uniref:ribonucleotide reductase subunit alpha n=1 Tax=uncultured Neptuniibacter sp. TaxID=502143 RepID=UPI002631F21B|nr:ribonucleotide reductase subunit alpha [uncultured Neptuniibacter sp.]
MSNPFNDLISQAQQQDQPQRLLFLFAQIEKQESKKHKRRQRGSLVPVMCVDKLPGELSVFSEFTQEADQISSDWDFMLAAGLCGEGGVAPSSDDAEPHLNKMANDLMMGADLSKYVILDREANLVVLSAA